MAEFLGGLGVAGDVRKKILMGDITEEVLKDSGREIREREEQGGERYKEGRGQGNTDEQGGGQVRGGA